MSEPLHDLYCTMRARELGREGWHDSVLLLAGEVVSNPIYLRR